MKVNTSFHIFYRYFFSTKKRFSGQGGPQNLSFEFTKF